MKIVFNWYFVVLAVFFVVAVLILVGVNIRARKMSNGLMPPIFSTDDVDKDLWK